MLAATLAILLAAPATVAEGATAPAPPAPPTAKVDKAPVGLVLTGSFFTRYEVRQNYDKLGKTAGRISEFDAVAYRARFGLATTPVAINDTQTVTLRFVPQGTGLWSDRAATLADSNLTVHEAVMRLSGDGYWFDAGRFEMIYGDHLVIGNVGWNETSRSFDGARAHIEVGDDGAWVDGFVTQITEGLLGGQTGLLAQGDKLFVGAYAGLGRMVGAGTDLDAYVFAHVWPSTDEGMADYDTAVEATLGSRFKKRSGNVDVRAEAGFQIGKRVKTDAMGMAGSVDALAYQGEAEAGIHLSQDKLRLALGGFYASGDDPGTADDEGWDQLYPTAHKFLGFMDLMGGRSNVFGAMVRVKAKSGPKVKLGADGFVFMRPETMSAVDSYTGIEADTWALYMFGKGLGLRGGYHLFLPNQDGPFGSDEVAHYVEVQLKYTLK